MRMEIDVSMDYQLDADPFVSLAIEAARTEGQTVLSESLTVDWATLSRVEGEDGLGTRVRAMVSAPRMVLRYHACVEVTRAPVRFGTLAATPLHELPGEAVTYLRPSRFCQSDMFPAYVGSRFGSLDGGAKIAAIRDWVEEEMDYVPGASHAGTTALDTFAGRQGVCRDYAHMVCAMARAANIPARYASVYGPDVDPPDFHAVAQVWLDGAWHLVDATGMCGADEMVIVAVGRDACDSPFMETGGPAQLIYQNIQVTRLAD